MKTLSAIIFILLSFLSKSQSLSNENFEDWVDNSAYIYPDGWITLNELKPEFGLPFTVFKSTDAKQGQYAARLETSAFKDGNNMADTLPSIMVYGSDINSGVTYSWPKRLKNISFYYKYQPNGIDSGLMYINIGYRNRKTNRYINQGGAYFLFTKRQDSYTKVTFPLYYNSNNKCDTFVFAFINSLEKTNGNRCKPRTVLIIDDIDTEWEDFPAVANITIPDLELGVYPNPATDIIHIKGLQPGFYTAKIIDMTGKELVSQDIEDESITIEKLKPGLYHLTIYAKDGSYSGSNYFIKN